MLNKRAYVFVQTHCNNYLSEDTCVMCVFVCVFVCVRACACVCVCSPPGLLPTGGMIMMWHDMNPI